MKTLKEKRLERERVVVNLRLGVLGSNKITQNQMLKPTRQSRTSYSMKIGNFLDPSRIADTLHCER